MQMRTLKVIEYKRQTVYIRNFKNMFEYLVPMASGLYTTHVIIRRNPLQALLGKDYTEKQLNDVVAYLTKLAEATVDYVLTPPKNTG